MITGVSAVMTSLQIQSESMPLTVGISSLIPQKHMTMEQFYAFCCENPDLRIERTAEGKVIVMPPTFADTGSRNVKISQQLANWTDQTDSGEVFDSSTGFTLPNGATRSPDASWIKLDRWSALSDEQKASFAPICPDFVIELRSSSDSLVGLQEKMQEYLDNGVQLGLLIDRKQRMVHVYRPDSEPEILENPESVTCDPELPGFTLEMKRIW